MTVLLQILAFPFKAIAFLLILFYEWGWEPLAKAAAIPLDALGRAQDSLRPAVGSAIAVSHTYAHLAAIQTRRILVDGPR
jgi:hypothetical protein